MIDYAQLGLLFKLYSCEVLFNRGLCYIYLQQMEAGMQDFSYAVKEKVVEDHNVIDDAIREQAEVCESHNIYSGFSSNLIRAILSSQFQSELFTDPMKLKFETSRQKIILARPDLWQLQIAPMPSRDLQALKSRMSVVLNISLLKFS
jgi:hypothetical protein